MYTKKENTSVLNFISSDFYEFPNQIKQSIENKNNDVKNNKNGNMQLLVYKYRKNINQINGVNAKCQSTIGHCDMYEPRNKGIIHAIFLKMIPNLKVKRNHKS